MDAACNEALTLTISIYKFEQISNIVLLFITIFSFLCCFKVSECLGLKKSLSVEPNVYDFLENRIKIHSKI